MSVEGNGRRMKRCEGGGEEKRREEKRGKRGTMEIGRGEGGRRRARGVVAGTLGRGYGTA